MKFILRFCGKKALLVLFVTSFIILIFDLVGIALIFPFLNLFVSPEKSLQNHHVSEFYNSIGFNNPTEFIFWVGVFLIAIYSFKLFLKTILNFARFYTSTNITYRLSNYLFKGILNSRYDLFTDNSPSEMIGIVNAQTVCSVICMESIIKILNEISFLIIILLIGFYINPGITLISSIIFIFLAILLYFGLVKKIEQFGKIHTDLNLRAYSYGYSMASSIKDIKIMHLENQYCSSFSEIWRKYTQNDAKAKTAKAVPMDLAETLVFCGLISVCLYLLILKHDLVDMIPVLGVLGVTAMRVLPSFNRIVVGYNEFRFYKRSLQMVCDLIDKIDSNQQEITHLELPFRNNLKIEGLSFSYGEKKVLDNISLIIERGGSFGFVGSSGAGKSTLLDVMVGLREADSGEFYLDGTRFDPFKTDVLKNLAGYVPQSVNLIDDSIAFNISFDRDYDQKKIEKVISIVRLEEFIAELPDGLETVIGERGTRVSGGQKQRIGIARALYRDPWILIFDEATSALDTVTERELMREINQLSGDKTLIIVAHRLSTVEQCDTIHLLDKGQVIARGSHKELLKSSEQYRSLYNQQEHSS